MIFFLLISYISFHFSSAFTVNCSLSFYVKPCKVKKKNHSATKWLQTLVKSICSLTLYSLFMTSTVPRTILTVAISLEEEWRLKRIYRNATVENWSIDSCTRNVQTSCCSWLSLETLSNLNSRRDTCTAANYWYFNPIIMFNAIDKLAAHQNMAADYYSSNSTSSLKQIKSTGSYIS